MTSPARTAADLARNLHRHVALSYLDALLRLGLTSVDDIGLVIERSGGLRWIEQARELVALADGRAESPGESWMRLRWHDAGLPRLEPQIEVREHGVVVARIDAGLRKFRIGIEYDGEEFHGPDADAFDAARRRRLARDHGWRIAAVRKEAVLGRSHGFERLVAEQLGLDPVLVPWEHRLRGARFPDLARPTGNQWKRSTRSA